MAQPFRTLGSASTSPSNHSLSGSANHTITLSSLVGDYVYLTVQVSRDLQPVVYSNRRLPVAGFDLSVSDATLVQLQAISSQTFSELDVARNNNTSLSQWQAVLSDSLLSLPDVMKVKVPLNIRAMCSRLTDISGQVLPPSFGLYLDLACPTKAGQKTGAFSHNSSFDLNSVVDSVLKAVYHTSPLPSRRRIAFSSFDPDICAVVNWKQPNCEFWVLDPYPSRLSLSAY